MSKTGMTGTVPPAHIRPAATTPTVPADAAGAQAKVEAETARSADVGAKGKKDWRRTVIDAAANTHPPFSSR